MTVVLRNGTTNAPNVLSLVDYRAVITSNLTKPAKLEAREVLQVSLPR